VDPSKIPGGELTDDALRRLDIWTDGGTLDLFNFGVDAQHLVGALAARGRDVQYFTDFVKVPGLDPTQPLQYIAPHVVWDDIRASCSSATARRCRASTRSIRAAAST